MNLTSRYEFVKWQWFINILEFIKKPIGLYYNTWLITCPTIYNIFFSVSQMTMIFTCNHWHSPRVTNIDCHWYNHAFFLISNFKIYMLPIAITKALVLKIIENTTTTSSTMLCPLKVNSEIIELTVHNSPCYKTETNKVVKKLLNKFHDQHLFCRKSVKSVPQS